MFAKYYVNLSCMLLMLVFITACSSSTATTSNSNSRTPQPSTTATETNTDKPKEVPKIAYFSMAASNTYLQAGMKAAKDEVEKLGGTVDVFDGKFDPLTQNNQIQNAMASGKYNSFIIMAVDGNQICDIATKQAPKKGITVAVINTTLCGADTWQDGTLTFVGGQSYQVYENMITKIFNDNPEGGKIAGVTGPPTGSNALLMKKAFDTVLPKFPLWKLVAFQSTDYTASKGYQVIQNTLQANPDLKVIFSNYSGVTVGVTEAVKAAKRNDIKIYDFGGDKWSFDAVKNGDINNTIIMLPIEEVKRAVEAIYDHFDGKEVAKYIDLTKDAVLPGTPFVSKDNIDKFIANKLPEY